MNDELKPCPFCGGEARLERIPNRSFIVRCPKCGAKTPYWSWSAAAIKTWNKRAQPTFTPDELAEIYQMFNVSIHQIPISHYGEIRKSIVKKCDFALKGARENAT